MDKPQLPRLLDHEPYATCVSKLAALKERLTEAKTEATHYSGSAPLVGAESADEADLDKAVAASEKMADTHEKAKKKALLRGQTLERAIAAEEAKIPALREDAEDAIMRVLGERSAENAVRAAGLKRQTQEIYRFDQELKEDARGAIGDPNLPGFDPANRFGKHERYCTAMPLRTIH